MTTSELSPAEYKLIHPSTNEDSNAQEIPLCYSDLLIFGFTILPFIGKAWEWYSKS